MRTFACLLGLMLLAMSIAWPTTAQPTTVPLDTEQSTLSYTGKHPAHSWTGTSQRVQGRIAFDPEAPARSAVEIAVPVESFDSGNGNRDAHMMETVEGALYPNVAFVSESIRVETWTATANGYTGTWLVTGPLNFHGQTHPITIPVEVTVEGDRFEGRCRFNVSLDRFQVKRPKLLLVKIKDAILLEGTIRATLDSTT